MDKLEKINVQRIRSTAALHSLTLESLFSELKIAGSTLATLNKTSSGLTYTQLSKIAGHLNRGVLYFMEPGEVDPEKMQSAQFRSLANQKPTISRKLKIIIENVESYRDIYLTLREYISEQAMPFVPSQMPSDPAEAAAMAREWLDIPRQNSFTHTRAAIERAGALVLRSNGYHGKWKVPDEDDVLGFSIHYDISPIIFIRKQTSEARQLFTLAHELGHLLLHKNHYIDGEAEFFSNAEHEVEANRFAGYFLVPDERLAEVSDRERPSNVAEYQQWLSPLTKSLGVSVETVLRRLLDSGRLSESNYVAYRSWVSKQISPQKEGGSRAYRHREPHHLFGDQFVSAVIQSLQENKISLVMASQYLDNLKAEDVRKLEAYYEGN